MNRNKTLVLLLVVFALGGHTVLAADNAQGQEVMLAEQFGQAIEARGAEYVELRDAVAGRGAEALDFLRERLADRDWHVRMLAEAMIGRITDPERYRHYEELLVVPVLISLPYRIGPFQTIQGVAKGLWPGPLHRYAKPEERSIEGWLHQADAAPFLVELLVKDSALRSPLVPVQLPEEEPDRLYTVEEVAEMLSITQKTAECWFTRGPQFLAQLTEGIVWVRHKNLQAFVRQYFPTRVVGPGPQPSQHGRRPPLTRCYAAVRLGVFEHPSVVPALVEVLQSDDFAEVRSCAATGLGMTKSPQAVEPLVNALSDEVTAVRRHAAQALGEISDPRAVKPLTVLLENEDSEYDAIKALAKIEGPSATDALIAALKHESRRVREGAATGLGWRGDTRAVPVLIAALQDNACGVVGDATWALGELGDSRAVAPLSAALRHPSSYVRELAAVALGKIRHTEAVDPLLAALTDENCDVREATAVALGEIRDSQAVVPLIATLKDRDFRVRAAAALALGEIKDARAVEALIAAANQDERYSVQRNAAEALRKITGKNFGRRSTRWQEWWEQNKANFRMEQ